MNYIYDILLNFHEILYDFYDWNTNDNIINVRKIPLFKIPSNELKEIKDNNIRFTNQFLSKIQNKTEQFSSKNIKSIEYCCLFTDGSQTIAILTKNNSIQKSQLLVDEEIEVLEVATKIQEESVPYQIIKRSKNIGFKTRKEIELEHMIRQNLKKLKEDYETQQLKYLYYECFNKKEENKDKILSHIEYTLDKNFESISEKLYQFFELMGMSK